MGAEDRLKAVAPENQKNESKATFRLGLQSQPSVLLPLFPGKAYALSLRSTIGHVRLLCETLEANLLEGARCTLMTPMTPDIFFQRAGKRYKSRLQHAISTGQLMLATMIGDYKQNLVRFGPESLTREWTQCGVKQDTLLIIDCAEQIFSLQHADLIMAQVNMYSQWIEAVQCSTLFIFSALFNDGQGTVSYQRMLDNTSGSAHIDCQCFPAPLWIDFWDAGTEIMSEQRLEWVDAETQPVVRGAGHVRREVASLTSCAPSSLTESLLSDIDDVFCLGSEPITFSQRKQPKWRCVQDLIELLHATRNARTASVLIHVDRGTHWLHLAQAVHTMRQHCGTHLRIVIIDRDNIMRYQNELLLLNLGANTVVHGKAAITRLPLLLQSLLFQECSNSKAISFEKAIMGVTPSSAKGYLPPGEFYREVLSALAKSRILGVPHALLVSPLSADQDREAHISRFNLSRQGDLITANSKRCYIFLYGYAGTDLQAFLPRLFGLHNAHVMQDIALLNDEEAIVAALSSIEDEEWVTNQSLSQEAQSCVPVNEFILSAT
jgi:cellulose biosynthesis protein BcsE